MKTGQKLPKERMDNVTELKKAIAKRVPLTLGDVIEIATKFNSKALDIIITETEIRTGKTRDEILKEALKEFEHNLKAVEIGLTTGESLLMGTVGSELNAIEGSKLFEDEFIDKALMYTLAAQVGNHTIGIRPCAGTGDPCPYTGLVKAMIVSGYEEERIAEIACLLLKVGSMFRVGKISTGCNMEGFGAGATAIAAAMVELKGGSPKDMERAMVLALSPTIAVPCTPRVMVPGLCSTHIGGAILVGTLAAGLAVKTGLEVNVPIDVMIAMATEIHPISAQQIVPVVVKYMEPFFKTKASVEKLIDEEIKLKEQEEIKQTIKQARKISEKLASGARPLTDTLGEAVVGGSSQAVGSPTNTARIAHYLAKGKIRKVKIELYPELFARRGINIPGILMAAVFGASTADHKMYAEIMETVEKMGIEVEVLKAEEYQLQRITIKTDEMTSVVDALNRGGGRLVLRDASPSKEKAIEVANKLGIVLVEP